MKDASAPNLPVANGDRFWPNVVHGLVGRTTGSRTRRLFALLLSASVLPLTAKYLPFLDLSGHLEAPTVFLRWADPASCFKDHFTRDFQFLPAQLFEYFILLTGWALPPTAAANLFLALFVIVAPPLALAALLRAYQRDVRLALLCVPILYHRVVWFGFVNFDASVALAIFGLALVKRLVDRPAIGRGWGLIRLATLTVISLLLVAAHFFGAGVFLGLTLVILVCERPAPLRWLQVAGALLPAVYWLVRWFGTLKEVSQGGLIAGIRAEKRSAEALLTRFWDWSLHLDAGIWENLVLALAATSVVLVVFGRIRIRRLRRPSLRELTIPSFFVATLVMFVLLPFSLPVWWGVNVRLVPFLWIFAIGSAPKGRVSTWLLLPGIVAGLISGAYLTWDMHVHYNHRELKGFEQALDAIPRGQRVQFLFPLHQFDDVSKRWPMGGQIGVHYTIRRGGIAVPRLQAPNRHALVNQRSLPVFASWGLIQRFHYASHTRGWHYFVVKKNPTASRFPNPFRWGYRGRIVLVKEVGHWRVYRNVAEPQACKARK